MISVLLSECVNADAAVRSLLGQTCESWELLANDKSAGVDSSPLRDLAEQDRRIRLLPQPGDSSIGAIWNGLLSHASGEWIAYLGPSDRYDREFLANIGRHADKGELLLFSHDVLTPNAAESATVDPSRGRDMLFAQNITAPIGVAHRGVLAERIGGFNELAWQDPLWDFLKRAARAGTTFALLPIKSGRTAARQTQANAAPPTGCRKRLEANWLAGKPLYGSQLPPVRRHAIRGRSTRLPRSFLCHRFGRSRPRWFPSRE